MLVSIAEAILWGEQRFFVSPQSSKLQCFNRRGDSLGGATNGVPLFNAIELSVSIAEAILWGEQLPGERMLTVEQNKVSIAEAILWGEQRWL